jgi:amino acid adenylation domain-containing protein
MEDANGRICSDVCDETKQLRSLALSRSVPALGPGPATGLQAIPLSLSQHALWTLHHLDGSIGPVYHAVVTLRLQGFLDKAALRRSLDRIVARHEVLRTTFSRADAEPVQIIGAAECGLLLHEFEVDGAQDIEQVVEQKSREPFDLCAGPLIRSSLFGLSANDHVLVITRHEIIGDRQSNQLLLRELTTLYAAFSQGLADTLAVLPLQYADYAVWQRRWLSGDHTNDQREFWRQRLCNVMPLLHLPTDRPRPSIQSLVGEVLDLQLPHTLVKRSREFAQKQDVSLLVLLLGSWAVFLGRLSGQDEIVIGTSVDNRHLELLNPLIGAFTNWLAVRVSLRDGQTVPELLRSVKTELQEGYQHLDVPFEDVAETLNPVRSRSHSPVFQVTLTLNDTNSTFADVRKLSWPNLAITEIRNVRTATQHDLSLSLTESADALVGTLEYSADLFERQSIERLVANWCVLLEEIVTDSCRPVDRLSLLTDTERERVLHGFNDTAMPYPHDKLLHQLFEDQVRRTPHAIAAVHAERSLTYAELNTRANYVAQHLMKRGVEADTLVALYFERSLEMLIGVLGTLKAGGAYLPLDPNNPTERLSQLLADAAPRLVLTLHGLRSTLPSTAVGVLALDSDWNSMIQSHGGDLDPCTPTKPNHLAYVIYTSGSTGTPKGVMIEHRSIVNYVLHASRQFDVASGGGSLVCTSASFDLMLTGLYPPLLCGRAVRMCTEEHGVPALAKEVKQCSSLAPLKLTPSHLWLLEHSLLSDQIADRIKVLVLGGESLRTSAILSWRKHSPRTRIFNHYGPTETTVGSAVYKIKNQSYERVPIGQPISNTRIYILDRYLQPAPIGVSGEIYIGGVGVARGYLNQPALTAERFLCDPFTHHDHARMYRTGDLGRRNTDGDIEFLGRNDGQVKVRGYRIELKEIEEHISRHAQVKEAVVVTRTNVLGDHQLLAYAELRQAYGTESNGVVDEIRANLKSTLPEYMIPSVIIVLDCLPRTASGKLDRLGLPAPGLDTYLQQQYEAPRGDTEQRLARIWQELLQLDRVGRHDNFLQVGGNSLSSLRLIARVAETFNVQVPFVATLEWPTVCEMARYIDSSEPRLSS